MFEPNGRLTYQPKRASNIKLKGEYFFYLQHYYLVIFFSKRAMLLECACADRAETNANEKERQKENSTMRICAYLFQGIFFLYCGMIHFVRQVVLRMHHLEKLPHLAKTLLFLLLPSIRPEHINRKLRLNPRSKHQPNNWNSFSKFSFLNAATFHLTLRL